MAARSTRTAAAAAPRWLSDNEQQAWIAVAHLVLQLPGALDTQLQRDSGINLFEYLVLSRLSMAPERTLRMSELAELVGGSLSRLSNVVRRLEQRGFVRREPDPANRRYTNAILTEPGGRRWSPPPPATCAPSGTWCSTRSTPARSPRWATWASSCSTSCTPTCAASVTNPRPAADDGRPDPTGA